MSVPLSLDRTIQHHPAAGIVGAPEATDWAWEQCAEQTDMPANHRLVLLAVARHVRMLSINGLPDLVRLSPTVVRECVLDLVARQLLCLSEGSGVHVTLDCNCSS